MIDKSLDMSLIIPAYNEESYIQNVIKSVGKFIEKLDYEIIVVDNGSTDGTALLAEEAGARVIIIDKNTVSTARNIGVKASLSEIIVFLDADVRLTAEWGAELHNVVDDILDKKIITGSRYVIPENPTAMERNWFYPLSRKKTTYINSGNLLLSKSTFNHIGGFDESLISGEDYEFCMRAKLKGVSIVDNKRLKAVHDGYPKNMLAFIKREFWHGKGDCQHLKSVLKSKISMVSILFGLLNILLIYQLVAGDYSRIQYTGAVIMLLMFVMSAKIFLSTGIKYVIVNIPACYLYLISRFASCAYMSFKHPHGKSQ